MRSRLLFCISIVLITGLISGFIFISREKEIPEKRLELVFRDIGHQLLLHAKDSSSRVLPVQKINENTYQIAFQNQLSFIPDTLIKIVQQHIEKFQLPNQYIVNVKNCQHKETIFAYEISAVTGNLVPCTGRSQETGCYLIQIEFLKNTGLRYSWALLFLIPLSVVAFKTKPIFRKKETIIDENGKKDTIQIGKYQFIPERNLLILESSNISLSEKETKGLQIFSKFPNQIIEREMLMKEIWEEEGVIVISRNVDVLVSKLRKKLSEDSSIKIINIHGRGYKFVVE